MAIHGDEKHTESENGPKSLIGIHHPVAILKNDVCRVSDRSPSGERKVRSPQGAMPANGRGDSREAFSTESATENIPPNVSFVKGEMVRYERTAVLAIKPAG